MFSYTLVNCCVVKNTCRLVSDIVCVRYLYIVFVFFETAVDCIEEVHSNVLINAVCRRRFDFQSPSRMDRNVEMFMQIQRSLLQNRVIVQPAIYLRPEIDKISTVKLKDIVKRHLGIVVEKPSEATHVVYPQPNAREEGISISVEQFETLLT